MLKRLPLHFQLMGAVLVVVTMLALCFAALALWSNQTYHHEATQRLHSELADYIVDHQKQPLINNGVVNKDALKQMAMHAMAINPLIEVYLLDGKGKVLGHALPIEEVKLQAVNVRPIQQRLQQHGSKHKVVYGDNPRVPGEQRVFSVAPISDSGKTVAYLYVVLNSSIAESVMEQLSGSHIAKLILFSLASLVFLALAISLLAFRKLTSPLRKLSREINGFQQSDWMVPSGDCKKSGTLGALGDCSDEQASKKASELQVLQNNFRTMQQRIISQFQNLQESSRLRRELISNVSHDLRTPLASLQGYLEALLLKREQLSEAEQIKYLSTAHRNSRRLTNLVSELFELSKLEAGQVTPELERFSLLELLYDVVQEYDLESQQQKISISIHGEKQAYPVVADIGLIQRVLQNLIDNAMRFTPEGGRIDIKLERLNQQVAVTVADTGFGIQEKDLPHIFDAYYSTHNNPDSEATQQRKQGTGLGLAIVKRILELHDSSIDVKTMPNMGASFKFGLSLN